MTEPPSERVIPSGTLYLWPDGVLFVGSDMVNEPHRHFTASVSFALEGTFKVYGPHAPSGTDCRGVLVAPNTEQAMDARGCRLVILQVDPETEDYRRLAGRFKQAGTMHLIDVPSVERLRAIAAEELGDEGARPTSLWARVIDELGVVAEDVRPLDPRIVAVLAYVKDRSLEPPPASELAALVGLSEGRLIHLFTGEMGLPIRRYMLWLRLRDAFLTLAEGSSLTHAAHRAGFADSAHMSRTFRGMFGIPPSFFSGGRGRVRTEFVLRPDLESSAHPYDQERWKRIVTQRTRKHKP